MIRRLGFVLAVAALVSGAGLLLRAEPPQTVGTWTSIGAAPENRIGAAAVALPDGRTLIAGGLASGTPTDAVVVFDPADSSFTNAGQLLEPRAGHTATLLEDGRVLIAGGTVNELLSGDLEIFDPSTGTSVLTATLAELRSGHAAARLGDGTVLIAGGTGTDGVLQTAEIFDPATGAVALTTSPLHSARTGASATTLIDGRVMIAGGNNGVGDLASAEIYNPSTQSFELTDTSLDVPRSGHAAVLLPHNNSVLIAGGSSNGVPQVAVDLFLPAQFPDPYSYGMGQFAPTGPMAAPRSGAAGGPHVEGYAFVVGGGAADAEVYRFATIKTDKDDYAPGQTAIITGSGWQPEEEVTLLFQEDPAVHDDYLLTVTADGEGNIYHDQWAPEEHDLGVRFYLMATGQQSGRRAQTTFTDNISVNNGTVSIRNSTCASGQTTFTQGDTVCARVVVTSVNGSGPGDTFFIQWLNPSNALVTPPSTTETTALATFDRTFATTTSTPTGTWTVRLCKTSGCSGGNLVASATFTLNAAPTTLTVVKHVVNDNGGTATAANWTLSVSSSNGGTGTGSAPGSESPGTTYTIQSAKAYSVTESGPTGYSASSSGACSIASAVQGTSYTCTFTNDDIQPKLTVTKVVVNDNGGTKVVADFPLFVNATGVTSGVQNGFNAGSYTVGETTQPGYAATITGDCAANGAITLAVGDVKSCTITNDDIQPKLTVTKVVVNDNGGTKVVADFPLFVNATGVTSGVQNGFNAGSYTVSETGLATYAATISGHCATNGAVTLAVGDVKSCTITNDDIGPKLTVTKVIVNDNGGTKVVADFPLFVNSTAVTSGVQNTFSAGTLTVSETGLATYAATISGDCAANGTITVGLGDVKSCTITNDDIGPKLTVTKVVVNDNGGTKVVADFPLFVNSTGVTSGVQNTFSAGTLTVSETNQPGYAGTISGDCAANGTITVGLGDVKSCTITNDDIQPKLTVTKLVVNDNGGTKVVADFPLFVNATGVTSGVQNGFNAGSYTVTETNQPGYLATISGDCAVSGAITLAVGDVKSCTITNDDIQPKLTVTKVVVNDNGGTAAVGDFTLKVNTTTVTSGTQAGFNAGTYTVSETGGPSGYLATISGDCAVNGAITLAVGDVKSCTITNDDIQPKLTVTKVVVNDNGGTKVVANFPLFVNATGVTSGVQNGFNAGSYTVTETNQPGYLATISGDCAANGAISLAVGDVKSCTITNNDVYTFQGFFSPIDMSPDAPSTIIWNTAKAGQAIPTKWRLTQSGVPVSNPASFQGLFSVPVACSSGASSASDEIEEIASGNSGLIYNGDGNWHFNWKTPTSYGTAPQNCRAMFVKFNDGTSSPVAYFKFRK